VYLESVLLELRCLNLPRALHEARKALRVHRGTGRLWAMLIQLEHTQGVPRQLTVFQQALFEVPKSGEVWCEGARICLNPYSPCFSLEKARTFLDFAIEFTPQYGDSFIEYLRLQALTRASSEQIERLWQLCINAEPNYGTLWFHCKPSVLFSTRQVLQAATKLIADEVALWRHVYDAAEERAATPVFRALAAATAASALQGNEPVPPAPPPPLELPHGNEASPDAAPAEVDAERWRAGWAEACDFVTGSVSLNRMQRRCEALLLEEQRALIYGGDMIVP